jgi:hypothetical protein
MGDHPDVLGTSNGEYSGGAAPLLSFVVAKSAAALATILTVYLFLIFSFSEAQADLYAQRALGGAITAAFALLAFSLVNLFSNISFLRRYRFLAQVLLPLCVSGIVFPYAMMFGEPMPISSESVGFRKLVFYLTSIAAAILLAVSWIKNLSGLGAVKLGFSWQDLCLFLLPAFPLANYLTANEAYFTLPLARNFFTSFLLLPAVIAIVTALIFQARLPKSGFNIPFIGVAVCAFCMNAMPMVTSLTGGGAPKFHYHALVLAASFVVVSLGYRFFRGPMYVFFAGLVVMATITSVPHAPLYVKHPDNLPKNLDPSLYLANLPKQRPDIFLLVYDSYVSDKVMQLYGIDNSSQTNYLTSHGFKIYPETYTVAVRTQQSISRMLSMRPKPLNPIGGPNTTFRAVKDWGYYSHMLGNGHILAGVKALRIGPDVVAPANMEASGVDAISSAIKVGYFRDNRFLGTTPLQYSEWVNEKRSMMKRGLADNRPYFLYAHSLATHLDHKDGQCNGTEISRFKQYLDKANQEMRDDIDMILASNRNAIIILAGDHGPGALSCEALERGLIPEEQITGARLADTYGTFLAIKWPDDSYHEYDDIHILQDTLFAVFSYLQKDRSVFSIRLPSEIVTNTNVKGAVKDGVIMIGPDKGKKLFESF